MAEEKAAVDTKKGDDELSQDEKIIRFLKQIKIVQQSIGKVGKDGVMKIGEKRILYPTKNNIVNTVKQALMLTDLNISSIGQNIVDAERVLCKKQQGGDFVDARILLEQRFMVYDTATGYREVYNWLGEAHDDRRKGVTIASSYAIRDFYMHFFNITVEGLVDLDSLTEYDADEVARKMTMEEIRQGLIKKARFLMQRVGSAPMHKEAKKRGFKPKSWELGDMEGDDLWTLIEIGLEKLAPSEKEDLGNIAGRNKEE